MKDILNEYVKKFQTKHKNLKRYIALFSILAVFTVIGVNWGLHQDGISMTDDAENMSKQVTTITGKGTEYDQYGDVFSSELTMNFSFKEGEVTEDQLNYYYEYPEGIIIPDGLLNEKKDLFDVDGKKAGVYYFEKTKDGKYRVGIDFDQDYVKNAGAISGHISFNGQVDGSKTDKDDNIKIVGEDNVKLEIPKDEIKYPDGVTHNYEIRTSKSGDYSVEDGKLVYTVYVYSVKGTPGDIDFEDVIKASGLTLGTPDVTVTKETVTRYYKEDGINYIGDDKVGSSEEIDVKSDYKDGKLTMTLPKIDPAAKEGKNEQGYIPTKFTRYKVKYTYDVSDIKGTLASADNTVTTTSKNNKTEVTSKADEDVQIKNEHDVKKTGKFDAANDQIKWTITVNSNGLDIAGSKLTDDMLAKLADGTKLKITPNKGYTVKKDSNGKITEITFDAVDNGKNRNIYTIEYYTPSQSTWGNTTVSNTAHFKPVDGDEIKDTANVTVSGGDVKKTFEGSEESPDGKTASVKWNAVITVPESGMPEGTTITDDPTKDQWGVAGGKQYLTYDQVIQWADNIYWSDANGNKTASLDLTDESVAEVKFEASDGNSYTYQEIKNNKEQFKDLTYTVCTVKLKKELKAPDGAKKIVFEYHTTADIGTEEIGTTYYKNTMTVGNKKADALYGHTKGGVIKTDENNIEDTTQKTNSDGTLTWKIKVSTTKDTKQLLFTDDLPEGVTLTGIKGEDGLSGVNNIMISEDGVITGTDGNYTITGNYTENKVTVGVTPTNTSSVMQAKTYTIVVTCKVDKDHITDYESGKTYTFKNEASVSDDSGKIGSADQTQKWTEDTTKEESKVIEKDGKWDNNTRRVKYSIKLNPDAKDIVEGSDVLTLEDEFTYYSVIHALPEGVWQGPDEYFELNAWLVPDSVKLYKAVKKSDGTLEKGEEITTWSWKVKTAEPEYAKWDGGKFKTSTLTGKNLPDSTAMILEYDYQLQAADMPEGYHTENALGLSNKAKLTGTSYEDDTSQSDSKWSKQDSTGEVTTDIRGVLYKVSKGNYSKTLPGAKFKVQKYDGSKYVDMDNAEYTTDAAGKLVIYYQKTASDIQYEKNVLYRVVETQAPAGYELPADPESDAFYFYFSSEADTTNKLPDTIPEGAADLSKATKIVYVENERSTTDLTVNKKWLKQNGDEDTGHTESIKVNLYQKESTTPPVSSEMGTLKGDIKLGDINNSGVWKEIPEQSYPVGTKINLVITSSNKEWYKPQIICLNGKEIKPSIDESNPSKVVYTYSFTIGSDDNEITGAIKDVWSAPKENDLNLEIKTEETGSDDESTSRLYGTYDITSDDNWSKTFDNLPTKGKRESDGKTVYYTYYVEEVANDNYETTYDNNEGIVSGTITINNTMSENPSYELPKTGGIGTTWLTVGGISLMIAASLCGYSMKRRRRKNIR